MSSPIVRFEVDASSAKDRYEGKYEAIREALIERTTAINHALQAKIAGPVMHGEVIKSHTGKAAASVRLLPTVAGENIITGGVQGGGGAAFYLKFLEDGTKGPYTIRPRDPKRMLAFRIGERIVFARKVTHPGLRAFEPMKGTLRKEEPNIIRNYQNAVDEVTG